MQNSIFRRFNTFLKVHYLQFWINKPVVASLCALLWTKLMNHNQNDCGDIHFSNFDRNRIGIQWESPMLQSYHNSLQNGSPRYNLKYQYEIPVQSIRKKRGIELIKK